MKAERHEKGSIDLGVGGYIIIQGVIDTVEISVMKPIGYTYAYGARQVGVVGATFLSAVTAKHRTPQFSS